MMMKKLAFATLVAMGMTAAAIAQQPANNRPRATPAAAAANAADQQPTQAAGPARRRSHGAGERSTRPTRTRTAGQPRGSQRYRRLRLLARRHEQRRLVEPSGVSSGDGHVDAARRRQRAKRRYRSQLGSAAAAQVAFDTADKDKDGKVTRDEASDVPGLNFTSADVNADASLSRQEFQTAMAGAQPRG